MRFLGFSPRLFFLLPKNRPLHRKTDCNSAILDGGSGCRFARKWARKIYRM
jgi:hypothetical protein